MKINICSFKQGCDSGQVIEYGEVECETINRSIEWPCHRGCLTPRLIVRTVDVVDFFGEKYVVDHDKREGNLLEHSVNLPYEVARKVMEQHKLGPKPAAAVPVARVLNAKEFHQTTVLLPVGFREMVISGRAEALIAGQWRKIVNCNNMTVWLNDNERFELINAAGDMFRYVEPAPLPFPFKPGFPPHTNLCLLLDGADHIVVGRKNGNGNGNSWVTLSQDREIYRDKWRELSITNIRGWANIEMIGKPPELVTD